VTAAFDAILFDADGVLQATDEKWFYAMTALIGTEDEEQVERFLGDIMTAELLSLAGQRPFEGPLGEVLSRWNVTEPAAEVLRLWRHVDVDRGVVAAVQELRADGVRCALATNQHPERAAYMRENLGYDEVFDDLFYSCDLGVANRTRPTSPRPSSGSAPSPVGPCCWTTTATTWPAPRRPA
jgi:putative hydrolase of the HAD superfamily